MMEGQELVGQPAQRLMARGQSMAFRPAGFGQCPHLPRTADADPRTDSRQP